MTSIIASQGATDPASWGEFFGRLGPAGFALICIAVIVAVVVAFLGCILMMWRGVERWNIKGIGEEFHASRLAQERTALATERAEKAQEDSQEAITSRLDQLLARLPLAPPQSPPSVRLSALEPQPASVPAAHTQAHTR